MLNIAINGFGRIGRHALKVIGERDDMQVVAINDLTDNAALAHLLKHDTAYPKYDKEIRHDETHLTIDGTAINAYAERNPADLPWKDLKVDIVLECTGVFRTKETASAHLDAGAKKVILSAPGKGEGIETYVRGVNSDSYAGGDIIDNASCTTNCTAPVMQVLEKSFGIEKAMLSTIHSYTAGQHLQDGPAKDLRRARAAAQNLIPTSTGAAIATTKTIPSLKGKFDGLAVRVPTITVSISDITVILKKDTTVDEINAAMTDAAGSWLAGIMAVTNEPLVSSDFIGDPHSSTVDLGLTKVVDGNMVKIIAWYDNEWGYANRLVEMAEVVGKTLK